MTFRQFLSVVEIRTKVISVSTYLLATLYALSAGVGVQWGEAVLLAVAVLFVDMGTTAFNSFYDYVRGVDSVGSTVEPGKVLVHEGVAPGHALIVSVALYLLAAGAGIVVAALSSWWVLAAGVVSMVVGFLYNGGPLPISRTPLGELFAGGFLGSVLFLVVFGVHADAIPRGAIIASLPSTLIIAAVLTVNNTCDLEGDRVAGRRTLSIVLGRRFATAVIDALVGSAFLLVLAMTLPLGQGSGADALPSLATPGAAAAGVGLGYAVIELIRMHLRGYASATKHANMTTIIRVVAVFTMAYAVALAVDLV